MAAPKKQQTGFRRRAMRPDSIEARMLRGESIPALRPPAVSPMDTPGLFDGCDVRPQEFTEDPITEGVEHLRQILGGLF